MGAIEFVKERIKSELTNIPLQDDAKFSEFKFNDFIKTRTIEEFQNGFIDNKCKVKYENSKVIVGGKEVTGDIIVNILYDENAKSKFESFIMERCTCDGTLIFMDELIQKVFLKLMQIQTINNEKVPDDFNENPFIYEILYTVGNFVICDEYGDFGTEEKPWLKSRFTVMLPIKFDIIKSN